MSTTILSPAPASATATDERRPPGLGPAPRPLDVIGRELRAEVDAAEQAWASTNSHMVRGGDLLIEAKAQLQHGEWLPWLAQHFGKSERTAQNWMKEARDAKSATAADFTLDEATERKPKRKPKRKPAPDFGEIRPISDYERVQRWMAAMAAQGRDGFWEVEHLAGVYEHEAAQRRADERWRQGKVPGRESFKEHPAPPFLQKHTGLPPIIEDFWQPRLPILRTKAETVLAGLCKLADAEHERTGEREPLAHLIEPAAELALAIEGIDEYLWPQLRRQPPEPG